MVSHFPNERELASCLLVLRTGWCKTFVWPEAIPDGKQNVSIDLIPILSYVLSDSKGKEHIHVDSISPPKRPRHKLLLLLPFNGHFTR